jgi:uncharacterized protein (DUF2384 family)
MPGKDLAHELKTRVHDAEHYANYTALVNRAVDVFGDASLASQWLSKPNPAFANKAPLQIFQEHGYARSAIEAIIEPVFLRIEHGIYA